MEVYVSVGVEIKGRSEVRRRRVKVSVSGQRWI